MGGGPGDLGFMAQRMVIVMGQEEGCSRTVSTPTLHLLPHRSCRGRCLIHPPGWGPPAFWDRGLGPGSALQPGGEPHVLGGSWEKKAPPAASTWL